MAGMWASTLIARGRGLEGVFGRGRRSGTADSEGLCLRSGDEQFERWKEVGVWWGRGTDCVETGSIGFDSCHRQRTILHSSLLFHERKMKLACLSRQIQGGGVV